MKAYYRIDYKNYDSRSEFLAQNIKCIFISYQRLDKLKAKRIADYLISAGIAVYFDEYDDNLKLTYQESNPNRVTDALCQGINNSSHMIVLVSSKTLTSKWVPFEIGYGYDKTNLFVLCLKGIPQGSLPEYLRVSQVIREIYDLNQKVSYLTNISEQLLLESTSIKPYNSNYHPLKDTMDSIITEKY